MNRFDQLFFSKYVAGSEIIDIAHKHIIIIIDKIILNYFFWVILPTFIYYNSLSIQSFTPFFVLEFFIIWMFIKNIYDIFNWYNDVWIITEDSVVELEWKLFSNNATSVSFWSIEWLEIIQGWIMDTIFWKWDIVIHKIWWENNFTLQNAAHAFSIIEQIDLLQKAEKQKEEDAEAQKIAEEEAKQTEEERKNHENNQLTSIQNLETIVKALSNVVETYLWNEWYKKDDSAEKKALIDEIKKQHGTIDLTK